MKCSIKKAQSGNWVLIASGRFAVHYCSNKSFTDAVQAFEGYRHAYNLGGF